MSSVVSPVRRAPDLRRGALALLFAGALLTGACAGPVPPANTPLPTPAVPTAKPSVGSPAASTSPVANSSPAAGSVPAVGATPVASPSPSPSPASR